MLSEKLNKKLISSVFAAALAGAAVAAFQLPDSTAPYAPGAADVVADAAEQARLDSIARADSVALVMAQNVVNKATDAYKNLKYIQYDGTTESELFPKAIGVHEAVLNAISTPKVPESEVTRLRGVLLDLDPLLVRGAVFYSSAGNKAEMNRFARACVDTRISPEMKGMNFGAANASIYPSIVYVAASDAYNTGDYNRALDYFEEYLRMPGGEQREQVALFYGQACINSGQQARGVDTLVEAANQFPTNYNLLMITLQDCLDAGETEKMHPLMDRAVLMRPDDEQLLNVLAALNEEEGRYDTALELYGRLYDMHPESLAINKHMALCYYNLAADYYNQALTEPDEKVSKRKLRQSNAYFRTASGKLALIVENEPSNVKYLRALAMTYGSLGEAGQLAEVNKRLSALGLQPVKVTGMPESIAYNDKAKGAAKGAAVPDFQDFARGYVEQNLAEFTKRREFERTEEFEKRMSQSNVYQEYERLCRNAEAEYLKKYAGRIKITDLELQPYDIDNESYLINSAMGPIVVKVPLKNKEAEAFKSGWESTQLRNARYYVRDNKVAIASVDLVTPGGKTYSFSADNAATYDFTEVQVDVSSFLAQGNSKRGNAQQQRGSQLSADRVIRAKSDVDENIPVTTRRAEKTVALIWANENYKNVSHVPSALNDGEAFAEYCRKTLGIPESQVYLMEDLTYAEMLGSIAKLRQLVGALGDGVDIIFYYAGHGLPDEATKDAFLMPVDGDGYTTAVTYPLKKLYGDLDAMRGQHTMVFLDACFSGATRDGGMLAEARGVALKPKAADPEGSMFVLSAASDQETALPYTEKNHGMFTYFLLKKLQETKGNVSLRDLSEYVTENVRKNSLTVNHKSQTPSVKVSGALASEWKTKKMRP